MLLYRLKSFFIASLLIVCGFLITSCSLITLAKNSEPFNEISGSKFFTSLYQNVAFYHIDRPNIDSFALSGLNGLGNIDNQIDHEITGNEITVLYDNVVLTTLPIPKSQNFESWGKLTAKIITTLQSSSHAIQQENANSIYAIFLAHSLENLDRYSRYFRPNTVTDKKVVSTDNININKRSTTVSSVSIKNHAIVIKIKSFNHSTAKLVKSHIKWARSNLGEKFNGIILDLRDNRGGRLDEAVAIADLFISEGTILKTHGRHRDAKQHYIAAPNADEKSTPLIILINGMTASAAEVLAAAINDHNKGLVIGTHSYGKGSVQRVRHLPNNGRLNLTWTELYTPQGYSISEFGVTPKICTANRNSSSDIILSFFTK